MPTKRQLSLIRESQFEYFFGGGIPVQNYGISLDENGLTPLHHTEIPIKTFGVQTNNEGEVVGKIVYDDVRKSLKIEFNESKSI